MRSIEIGDLVQIIGPHHLDVTPGRQAIVLDRIHYLQDFYDVPLDSISEEGLGRIPHRDEYSCKILVLGPGAKIMMMRAKWLKILSKVKED